MKTYLFVCEHGVMRSGYAARHFQELLHERGLEGRILPAGLTADPKRALRPEMVAEADTVFLADSFVETEFRNRYAVSDKPVVNLEVADVYCGWDYAEDYGIERYAERVERANGLEAKQEFLARPEIKFRWHLWDVLKSRNLAQYIINE